MDALIIIDMQKISFTAATPRFDSEGVIRRINKLSEHFRSVGNKVIFIQHDGQKEGFCLPNTEEWELLSSIDIIADDLIISKTANDSFYKTTLLKELTNLNVDRLVITGCATDFCVDSFIKSAVTNDFDVTVIKDGHTTADRPNLTAQQVIAHYNWVWSEMIPINGKVNVVEFDKFLNN